MSKRDLEKRVLRAVENWSAKWRERFEGGHNFPRYCRSCEKLERAYAALARKGRGK